MPEQTSCTPEGGLQAFAEALFTRYREEIPCQGEGRHAPLTKDKAGRKDVKGRLYRYWTCPRCRPRTKRNCRSYINEAEKALGREVVQDLGSIVLDERRLNGKPCDLLDSWLRGKVLPSATPVSSLSQRKRRSGLLDDDNTDDDTSNKRHRVYHEPEIFTDRGTADDGTAALRSAYDAREAIDRLIATLSSTQSPPNIDPITPTPSTRPLFEGVPLDGSDSDEVILLHTPPRSNPFGTSREQRA